MVRWRTATIVLTALVTVLAGTGAAPPDRDSAATPKWFNRGTIPL
ncbi:hypothetical protein ABZS88_19815 [Streptomyces sp. NPDC005480]|jgi:hypothetical protein